MAGLDKVQSLKQFTNQKLAVAVDKSKLVKATVNRGGNKELDVAIVKATTSQFHVVPKEKHVRTLKNAVHPSKSRRDVQYIIQELLKRLHGANDWVTALKTLVTFHRLMRETHPSFIEELIKVGEESSPRMAADRAAQPADSGARRNRGGAVLRVDDFIDKANIEGKFECSEWVRAYGRYLDEQLDVYSSINFYIEQEDSSDEGRLRRLAPKDLLFQLPKLQKLLARLTDCVPRGSAVKDEIVQLSLLLVVKESFKLYKVISEGVINLAEAFFEMDHLDAQRGLEAYKQYLAFSDSLQTYYAQMEAIPDVKHHVQFPENFKLQTPPPEFLKQMEDYARDAPRTVDGESGVPASSKVSPPLRRGKQVSSRALRAGSGGIGPGGADPGMVLPPGVAGKVQHADAQGNGVGSPTAAGAQAAGKQEVDLLSLDMEETLTVAEPAGPAVAVQNGGTAAGSPLTELFGGDSFSAPQPQQQQQQLGAAAVLAAAANGGNSFGGNAGNPFGSPTSLQQPAGFQQQPAGGFQQPGAAAAAVPMGPPPSLQVTGLGATGFGEPAHFGSVPQPQAGGLSPMPQQLGVPRGFSPVPGQQGMGGGTSPVPSMHTSFSSQPGGGSAGAGGGSAFASFGAVSPAQPSPSSASGKSPGAYNANIRDSALHDPFAEFNMLRKPEPVVPQVSPSMKAMRASGEGSLAALAAGASPGQQQQQQLRATHPGMPPLSPGASFTSNAPMAGSLSFTGGSAFSAGPAPQQNGFGMPSLSSFTSAPPQYGGAQHSFGAAAVPGAAVGGGFGGSSFSNGGAFGAQPSVPSYSSAPPAPAGASAFPMQFNDGRSGNGLL